MHQIRFLRVVAAIILGFLPQTGFAGEVRLVASEAELRIALAEATSGTEFALATGVYGVLSLRDMAFSPEAPMILRSVDPAHPARFSVMTLENVSNVLLEGVVFDYEFQQGDPLHMRSFQILSSDGITLRETLFDGDIVRGGAVTDDGFPTGYGLLIQESAGVTLENNEFRNFHRGLVVTKSQDITIRSNDLHSLRSDGMNFSQVERVLIENNHIHDFTRSIESEDHADMIQFWTNRTTAPSRNIVIRDNVLNSGRGWYTQSIFMRNDLVDRGLAGDEMFYENITIEGNVIINAHLHGITVGETDGLAIRNNTIVRNPASQGETDNRSLWTPKIMVKDTSRNVEILRNVTSRIDGTSSGPDWRVEDNLLVQDYARAEAWFYGTVFVSDFLRSPYRLSSFVPLPGGPLDGTGIGASRLAEMR